MAQVGERDGAESRATPGFWFWCLGPWLYLVSKVQMGAVVPERYCPSESAGGWTASCQLTPGLLIHWAGAGEVPGICISNTFSGDAVTNLQNHWIICSQNKMYVRICWGTYLKTQIPACKTKGVPASRGLPRNLSFK